MKKCLQLFLFLILWMIAYRNFVWAQDTSKIYTLNGHSFRFKQPKSVQSSGCGTLIVVPTDSNLRGACPYASPCDDYVLRDSYIPSANQTVKRFVIHWTIIKDNSGNGGIDQGIINDLMEELNVDFDPWKVTFCTDDNTSFLNNSSYSDYEHSTEEAGMKNLYATDPSEKINIYVVNNLAIGGNPYGGVAKFPFYFGGGTDALGGIVLAISNCTPGYGHSLAHEMGHIFGLYHTFHGISEVDPCTDCYEYPNTNGSPIDGNITGDWIDETNPHTTNIYNCFDPITSDVCNGNFYQNTPFDNFMSYSSCREKFVEQQAGRMHCMIESYMISWEDYGTLNCSIGSVPIANFNASNTSPLISEVVTLYDLSINNPSSWEWNITPGGWNFVNGTNQNTQNPQLIFNTAECYSVYLLATNSFGSDDENKYNYLCANSSTIKPNLTTYSNNISVSGNSISIEAAIINDGTVAANSSTMGYFLSIDSYITSSDFIIGNSAFSSLNPNSTNSIATNLNGCSAGVPNGIYYFGYIIDYQQSIDEENESDNSYILSFPKVNINCCPITPTINPSGSILFANTISMGVSYQWYKDGFPLDGEILQYIDASDHGAGSYIVNVMLNGCTKSSQPFFYVGIYEFQNNNNEIAIYPNPNSGNFILSIENPSVAISHIELINILGQKIKEIKCELSFGQSIKEINISDLANAVYYLKITTKSEIVTKKLIIER